MSKGLFAGIQTSASGLRGQRVKMDVVARNLANAETTHTEDGTPYRRQRAVFHEVLQNRVQAVHERASSLVAQRETLARTQPGHLGGLREQEATSVPAISSEVTTAPDASDFRMVYDPGHPDADEEGYVMMPNVDVVTEMVDMIAASRAYEANLSAVQSAKDMFTQALKI